MNPLLIKYRVMDWGLAKRDRFEVTIPGFSETTNLLAKSVNSPGISFGMGTYRYHAPIQNQPNDIIQQDLSISFYVDKKYKVRSDFEEWKKEIVDENFNTWGYRNDYGRDIKVVHMDNQLQEQFETNYLSCVPKDIGELRVDFESSEEVMILDVNFIYERLIPNF